MWFAASEGSNSIVHSKNWEPAAIVLAWPTGVWNSHIAKCLTHADHQPSGANIAQMPPRTTFSHPAPTVAGASPAKAMLWLLHCHANVWWLLAVEIFAKWQVTMSEESWGSCWWVANPILEMASRTPFSVQFLLPVACRMNSFGKGIHLNLAATVKLQGSTFMSAQRLLRLPCPHITCPVSRALKASSSARNRMCQ